jgi:hypothetical protein
MTEIPVPSLDDVKTAASSPAETASPAPAPEPSSDAPAASQDAPPAASSPAPDATPVSSPGNTDPKAGLLAAVTKAVQPKTETKPETGSERTDPGKDPSKAPDPNAPQDFTPEEIKSYAPSTQQRIKSLLAERNSYRDQAREIEPFKAYMVENDLSAEDLTFGLQALATLRQGDFEGFLQQVHPFVQLAMEYTGRALPPDIQEAVKQGKMTPDVAVGLTRQRYDLGTARQRLDRHEAEMSQIAEENARQVNRSAVAAWEQSVKQSDPDYARKLDVAKAYVSSIRAEYGDPQSPDDALAIAQEAYRRASETLRAALPPRAPTHMSPSGVQRPSNPSAVAAPRSLMEAAMQGLERARHSRAS